jgi:predicted O-methyltransferase YrrM
MGNALWRILGRSQKPRRIAAAESELPVYDVTAFAAELDWDALEVLRWAPVWMTRAERLLLFTLIFSLRPARYLEIGTLHGGSALIVSAAMKASGNAGRLTCIDPRPQIAPEHWQRLEPHTTLLEGFSPNILPQAREAAGGSFDFVLIDGDHSYAGVLRDANSVLPFVADGAYLLFHDSFYSDIVRAMRDFAAQHRDQIVDFGALTREVTLEARPDAAPVRWGGLRLMQVRRNGAAG